MPESDAQSRAGQALRRRLVTGGAVLAALLLGFAALVGWVAVQAADEDGRAARVAFVRLTGLPDLALATGSPGLRHPSLAAPSERWGDDPQLPLPLPAALIVPPPTERASP